MKTKVYLTKISEFEAAHYLEDYNGACSNMHGHSYKLEVTVSGFIDVAEHKKLEDCIVMDFKDLKSFISENVLKDHDHALLNKLYQYPTAEYMVSVIFYYLSTKVPKNVILESVKLWETSTSFAECRGEGA